MSDRIKELIAYGNLLVSDGYTLGTGGNLSFFDRQNGLMYITPSGIPFDLIREEDIVALDLEGNIVKGNRLPSSEWAMHLIFYKERQDLNAIIHAHTTYSTVFAVLHRDLPASHYMLAVAGPDVRCAEYASYGTKALAANAFEGMKERKAVILANHGILAGGKDLAEAYNVIREVEYCAKIHIMAESLGKPVLISPEEMQNMGERFKNYGQRPGEE